MAGIPKDGTCAKPEKGVGIQPLTFANLKEFHEEEESWEDPRDFGAALFVWMVVNFRFLLVTILQRSYFTSNSRDNLLL